MWIYADVHVNDPVRSSPKHNSIAAIRQLRPAGSYADLVALNFQGVVLAPLIGNDPGCRLPEMTFPSPAFRPPITVVAPKPGLFPIYPSVHIPVPFGTAPVPDALVPM